MLSSSFVTLLLFHTGGGAPRSPAAARARRHLTVVTRHSGRPAASRPTAGEEGEAVRSDELYSLRARRRFAAYLRMRLLEMREAGLERAADAVERRLSPDALFASPPPGVP